MVCLTPLVSSATWPQFGFPVYLNVVHVPFQVLVSWITTDRTQSIEEGQASNILDHKT